MVINKKIAVICNYELLQERVGGMDYFYWLFDAKCKQNNIQIDWFFPNKSNHGDYQNLNIIDCGYENTEEYFYNYCLKTSNNYSHVVTHFVELCTPVFKKIKKITNAIIIAVDHNPRPINGYTFKKKIEKRLKGALYSKNIDQFVGVSNYTVNEMLKDFGKTLSGKTITVYNGVLYDNILIRNHRNIVKPTFLVASHLRKSKGIQDLIVAVSLLPKEISEQIKIDIYGNGPHENQLKNIVNEYNLANCFHFMGSKPNLKDIFYLYDYMLQPTHMECFSLSILESLAANVPVITTNVGGNEEVITNNENGCIFEAKNTIALQKIIQDLYQGNKMLSGNTRTLIEERFSLEKMVQNHFSLINHYKS